VALLLLVLIAPLLGSYRETHRRSVCLNNLKQIGLAIRLYSGDCEDKFPADPGLSALGSFGMLTNTYWVYHTSLGKYQRGPFQTNYQTWACPSDVGVVVGSPTKPFTSVNLSYAYGGIGLSEAAQPDTPIACDRSSQGDPVSTTPWSNNQWTHKSDGGNVLFADGHVAWFKTLAVPMYRGKNP